ncbi:hypothetical protein ABZP36_001104 [Zizania latifolia]
MLSSSISTLRLRQPTGGPRRHPPPPMSHQFWLAAVSRPSLGGSGGGGGALPLTAPGRWQAIQALHAAQSSTTSPARRGSWRIGSGSRSPSSGAEGHTLLVHSRSDYSSLAASVRASYFQDLHDLCECHLDVVNLYLCSAGSHSVQERREGGRLLLRPLLMRKIGN